MQYVCPRCHGRLTYSLDDNYFTCMMCARVYGAPAPLQFSPNDDYEVRSIGGTRMSPMKPQRVRGVREDAHR